MIDVPTDFVRSTITREGERGRAWTASLPGLTGELLERWECAVSGPVMHGQVGIVVPVLRADRSRAVLKISFPHPGNVHEPDALAAWAGRGAVRLHARDDARFAMLLEQAEPETLAGLGDMDTALTEAGRLVRELAIPAPAALPGLADRMPEWESRLRAESAESAALLPRRAVQAAVATFRDLGREQPRILLHGDLHYDNILRAEREPWLVTDPKGYAGDPASEAFTLIRTRLGALLTASDPGAAVRRSLDIFADAAGLDRVRVHRWTQARAVLAVFRGREYGDPGWLIEATARVAGLLT
ncbi:aminoglycoside phosphotransferase family protein [Streptomyces sp. NBC_01267]|uniref:aminoglycoside phosphotransferase family protein n=1 Tax=Streptomyces sp. NBC_01267 TaxID=2903805 RepID=UPI002E314ED5|nr:aminoglycoside phosphotransferase family protein [Streptomyces sp. NBC_01267]